MFMADEVVAQLVEITKPEESVKNAGTLSDKVAGYLVSVINNADEQAAAKRVESLRQQYPEASADLVADLLIKEKCRQTGAVGAVTSGASVIPGLGTVAALTFGVAADIGLTFKLQAELVLELAAAYGYLLSNTEKQRVVMLITGISAGTNQILSKVGKEIAEQATERLASKSVTKAIPVLGVAASAGVNILSTYLIGQRAKAYFGLGAEAMGDWTESLRAITGVDTRPLTGWLVETTENSWKLVNQQLHSAKGLALTAGKSLGEVVVAGTTSSWQIVRASFRFLFSIPGALWRTIKAIVLAPFRLIQRLRPKSK